MRILFLTSRLPYPPYRGDKLKAYNILKCLKNKHDVYLISFVSSQSETALVDPLHEFCKEIHTVKLTPWQSAAKCLVHSTNGLPLQVSYYSSQRMHKKIAEIIQAKSVDVIHTQLIRMAQYSIPLEQYPRVLELTDAVSLYLGRYAQVATNPLRRKIIELEHRRLLRYEQVLSQYDCCTVSSELDRAQLLQNVPRARIEILPNVVDGEILNTQNNVKQEPWTLVFSGNMSYPPNEDAAQYFVHQIFPILKKKYPKLKLYLVGQDPSEKVKDLSSQDIIITGFVENIGQYYSLATVAISPIRFGAGVLNKILEPMSLGIPVVATSIGVHGTQLENGKHLLVADNPELFVHSVIRLFEDGDLRKSLGKNSKEIIRNQFGLDHAAEILNKVYSTAIAYHNKKNNLNC